ncbi:hypothetical protein [Paenibacillus sp. MBLB4367]|uniref:hypothetical protein n=1 Tax=Paenibacillus sp. MBLB4367 TaxID=3384767 RepID=UPI00390830C8
MFERLAEVVRRPKLIEDIVTKLNKDRTKSVVPLQKELAAIEKELESIERQRKKYFKLYEASDVDDDLFVERLNELKQQQEQFTQRKAEAERQLADSTSDPIPLQHVRQALSRFQEMLEASPPETQKTLFQTMVKQVHVKDGRTPQGIELEIDAKLQKHFFEFAPSAQTAEGAFASRKQKFPAKYTIVI